MYRFLQILLFSDYLHIVYIGIPVCISTLRNNVSLCTDVPPSLRKKLGEESLFSRFFF